MERRIEETEKVGSIYKNLLADLPTDIDNYKTFISKTREEIILEQQNQHEQMKRKLALAERQIEESGNSDEEIAKHLRVLRALLSKPDERFLDKTYDLRILAELDGRKLEDSVSLILKSRTLDEFLKQMGFDLQLMDEVVTSKMLFNDRKTPDGEEVETNARAHYSVNDGWFATANGKIWLNDRRLIRFREEFDAIRTII
jgi:ribosome-associated toxin RatA of RatAB toxin-antitoxin module